MPIQDRAVVRDEVFRLFPGETAAQLVEFNKHLAAIDADYLIFVARKSLRLYDLLVGVGGPVSQRHVLSDHVLDQNLDVFRGKRIALIDDTLILGTTLAEAKRKLVNAGASEVTTHVFAVDRENWCTDLIVPDRIFAQLNQKQMLTFCAREVLALSVRAVPYLSDFPFSEALRLKPTTFALLHSLPDWETYNLTTPVQEREGVAVYSVLPADEILEIVRTTWGEPLYNLVELMKVRVFSMRTTGAYRTMVVPLITLKSMEPKSLDDVFDQIVSNLSTAGRFADAQIKHQLNTPISRLRFVQYVLSLWLGELFFTQLTQLGQVRGAYRFDLSEAARLFGPWLRGEFQAIHQSISMLFTGDKRIVDAAQVATFPAKVVEKTKAEFHEFVGVRAIDVDNDAMSGRNLLNDLINAFIGLHRKYEIPAKEEVHRLGRRVLEVAAEEAPHRDRLKFGFVWSALTACLVRDDAIRLTLRRSNLLSLLLDHLIDLGIAVPVLSNRDGVLFRGYRYGEDVLFGDQQLALAHETIAGYVKSVGSDTIQKIIVEKLLVSLVRVGVSKQFLTVVEPRPGIDGIVRIGYHLHGAVAMLPTNDTIFADDQDSYLSRLLVDRGVLEQKVSGGMYSLGKKPEASYLTPTAESDARELGLLLGLLSKGKTANGRRVFDRNDLIVLTSCTQPRDAAGAVAAELRQFVRWFDRTIRHGISALDPNSEPDVATVLDKLVRGQGYLALNSARLKIEAYRSDRARLIVESCATHLASLEHGDFLSSHWLGDWGAIIAEVSVDQKQTFDRWMNRLSKDVLIAALGVFTVELALCSCLLSINNHPNQQTRFDAVCRKIVSYFESMPNELLSEDRERRLLERVLAIAESRQKMETPLTSVQFALKWFDDNLGTIRAEVYQADQEARNFGRTDKRVSFAYVLWYDIVDSTGQKSGLTGEALVEYRNRVRTLKETIKDHLYALRSEASRSNAVIHIEQGDINSKDDEKHLFFTAARGLGWLRQVARGLLLAAEANGIGIRVMSINTDFAGLLVQKYATDANVTGAAFWEHLSRVKPELKKIEAENGAVPGRSYFWIGGRLVGELSLDGFSGASIRREIATTIENVTVVTPIEGGPVTSQ